MINFSVSSDAYLNTRTGTVCILCEICPVGISWPDYTELFELIADEHNIAHMSCFIINPHGCQKYPANIAKISLKGQDLPDIYI